MKPAILLEQLKPHVQHAIRYGEFLLSTNTFSQIWIEDLDQPEAQTLIHDILVGFWQNYVEKHPGNYRLLTLEKFEETSVRETSMTMLARRVVQSMNYPNLQVQTVIVDPDSFEVFIDECPDVCQPFLIVSPTVSHDLLFAACQHLHELGHTVTGIVTPVETECLNGQEIREVLGVDFIPFIRFRPSENRVESITEIHEEPYVRYHGYFGE
jgi:hypothetical protein